MAAREGSGISASREPGPLDALVDRHQTRRPLWVATTGVMELEHRVRRHEQHPRTVTQPGIAETAPPTLLVIMTDDTLRWRGGWARLGSWRGRPDVAYLSVGAERPPTPEIVDRCVGLLRGRGYSAVVTSALGLTDALPFIDAGFSVRERLHLLAHSMGDLPAARASDASSPARGPRRR